MLRFFGRLAWGIFVAAAVFGIVFKADARPAVTSVTFADKGGFTRLVVELTDRADYRVFVLSEPMRLVIDLPPLEWRLGGGQAAAHGLVAGYRYGQFDAATSRLVLDLAEPTRVRRSGYELSAGRQRLVFELERVSMEAFLADVQPWTASGVTFEASTVSSPRAAAPAPLASADQAVASASAALPWPPPPAPRATIAPAAAPATGAARSGGQRAAGKRVVAVDAGHGGVDPGAVGTRGTYEKDITLAVARELRRQLERTGRYRVVMTRDDDIFVRLRDRVARARAANAELFVSIHADSSATSSTRGASVYTLSETASDAEAAALAARENYADIIAGVDLSAENKEVVSILIDLAQRETMNLSAAFASVLVDELGRDIQLLPNRPHRFAGFAVLRAPDVPSVLIELGYVSNQHDEKLLTRPHYRSKVAAAIVRAIDQYFARKSRS
ncbi:MAG TPA: N-acetylmuramoyl-L-alanine amidase [Alphaproteobacteria bacterium]